MKERNESMNNDSLKNAAAAAKLVRDASHVCPDVLKKEFTFKSLQEQMIGHEDDEEREMLYQRLGYPVKYVPYSCPKCGRQRVELWSSGRHICQKCHWCVQEEVYYNELDV